MSTLKYTPESEICARIEKVRAGIAGLNYDGAIITHHTNLFYLSGTSQNGHLFIPKSGPPVLMIKKSLTRAREESPIDQIVELKNIKKMPEILRKSGYSSLKTLGFELDIIPYNTYAFYRKIFNKSEIADFSSVMKNARLLKSPYEIELLRESCNSVDAVFEEVPEMIHEGMTEIELASLFEAGLRKRGYGGCCKLRAFNQDFFLGNVVSGSSGAVPTYFDGPVGGPGVTPANNPHGAGWKKIRRNEIIYIDYTGLVNGYTADETRMFVVGTPPERIKDAYQVSLAIQKELVDLAKKSVECEVIFEKAIDLASRSGYGENFLGMGENRVKFVGHGVGLELDESPIFAKGVKMKLEPGMTFALEPKFVFPEGAVGIENTYVMRETGAEVLTRSNEEIIRV